MAESYSGTKKTVSIEDYLEYFDSGGRLNLTCPQLNQIVAVHGFKKFNKVPKAVLLEAMAEIELMDLTRSTKNDNDVSPLAQLTLKEALDGLKDLKWQECHVSSLITLNALCCDLSGQNDAVPLAKRKRKTKNKKNRDLVNLQELGNGEDASTTVAAAGTSADAEDNGTLALVKVSKPRKSIPKKKKKSPRAELLCSTDSSGAAAGDVSGPSHQ